MPSDNFLEEKSFFDSITQTKNNKIELNFFDDEEFKLNFNKDIINEHKKIIPKMNFFFKIVNLKI